MKSQSKSLHVSTDQQTAIHFGAFLRILRDRQGIKQIEVLKHLPDWSQVNYSRVETGLIAPPFGQLVTIYTALHEAGVTLTAQDRQQFLALARVRIEVKRSYLEHKSDQEWDALRLILSRFDHRSGHEITSLRQDRLLLYPNLMEIRHLVGRADWLASVIASLQEPNAQKIVVLQGPTGIGKSTELNRIAYHFIAAESHPYVVSCVFPDIELDSSPENALDQLLGSLLSEIRPSDAAAMQTAALSTRITFALNCLTKAARPVLILVDNAEHLIDGSRKLAPCWQNFLERFLRSQHHASLVLATQEWPGWARGESIFVDEQMIPMLTIDESVELLQRQHLAAVPVECLQQISEAVGGIPLCLEWVASLVKEPLWLDAWDETDDLNYQEEGTSGETLTRRLLRLLEEHKLLGGEIANRLAPLLERIIAHRLSAEAAQTLHILALAGVPVGKPALARLCPRPSLLRELRNVSLLTAHAQRVQVLPMVAVAVRKRLSSEQQRQIEEQLIEAYLHWLEVGSMTDYEMGTVIAELVTLYLNQHRLLDTAQLLIYHGWMSFNIGYGPRVARLANKIMQQFDWKLTPEDECGGLLLYDVLATFLGKAVDAERQATSFEHILTLIDDGKVTFQPATVMHSIRMLMFYHMNHRRFEEAQTVLTAGTIRLEPYQHVQVDVQASLLAQHAWLLAKWSDYLEERKAIAGVSSMREEAITLYR